MRRLIVSGAALVWIPLVTLPAASAPADTLEVPATAPTAAALDELHLRRAVLEWSRGDLDRAVEELGAIDFPAGPSFAGADRAAFLLAVACARTGDRDRLRDLASAVASWTPSAYTRWVELLALADRPATGFATGDAVTAGILLVDDDPEEALRIVEQATPDEAASAGILEYLRALALHAMGRDDTGALEELAASDPMPGIGGDLRDAALIRLATRVLSRGGDPAPFLAAVPPTSRLAARARHIEAMVALERDQAGSGLALLDSLRAGAPSYDARGAVMLTLAAHALDAGDWSRAEELYAEMDAEWRRARERLSALRDPRGVDSLWAGWESGSWRSDGIGLDLLPARRLATDLATRSRDLTQSPDDRLPGPESLVRASGDPADLPARLVPPPVPDDRDRLDRVTMELGTARNALAATLREIRGEEDSLARRRRYLELGQVAVGEEIDRLERVGSTLDAMMGSLDDRAAWLTELEALARERFTRRAGELSERATRQMVWLDAMQHFHVDGPGRERAEAPPDGLPAAGELLAHDGELGRALRDLTAEMAAKVPDLLARSFTEELGPGLIDRVSALRDTVEEQLDRARTLRASIGSDLLATAASSRLVELEARAGLEERAVEDLVERRRDVRLEIGERAVDRALAALDGRREAIDYGLAAAAYALAVDDHAGMGESTSGAGQRQLAIDRLGAFLDAHPGSFNVSDARFRLADVLLIDARESFQARMASFLDGAGQPDAAGARAFVPFVDYEPALALYLAILADDPGYEHRDAALFHAAMIETDIGDPAALSHFHALLEAHPDSRFRQEAELRTGDLHFDGRRYPEAVPHYERAASGGDAGLTAIALYKLGWCEFNRDDFLAAADAFRRLIDLYGSEREVAIEADLRPEAEDMLVHALARAGGAGPFATYFDEIGSRSYERRILDSMAALLRRFSLHHEAIGADQLAISRFPLDPDALTSARHVVDTYERMSQPDAAREAWLGHAYRFAPGGDWQTANVADSVRAGGDAFARDGWKRAALHHHRQARLAGEAGAVEEWQEARGLYAQVLETWPDHPEAPRLHLHAGEVAAHLGDYRGALSSYSEAAASDTLALAREATWQWLAVTDAWYESTRDGDAPGDAEKARSLLDGVVVFGARYPTDPRLPDLQWRAGNLAFAHGWYERAASSFRAMTENHPGDERAPEAATLRADALYRLGDFAAAGRAYEQALSAAGAAGDSALASRVAAAIPVCYYRHADEVARSNAAHAGVAALFELVATRWPEYENAPVAQYRAALAWLETESVTEAVRAFGALINRFPASEYVKDARLQIAKAWERAGERERAALAYVEFADHHRDDESAGEALLTAAGHLDAIGSGGRADDLRLTYIDRYPDDVTTAAGILVDLAARDLARVGPELPISRLLASESHLARYLTLVDARADLADADLLARTRFLEAEETFGAFDALSIDGSLSESIETKRLRLEETLAAYGRCADVGVREWSQASACRIGQALVAFGEALEQSPRPAELTGDDLRAYDEVLMDRAWQFTTRGEDAWAALLRRDGGVDAGPGTWAARARDALWPRLARRFVFRPEVEFPLIEVTPPDPTMHAEAGVETPARGRVTR